MIVLAKNITIVSPALLRAREATNKSLDSVEWYDMSKTAKHNMNLALDDGYNSSSLFYAVRQSQRLLFLKGKPLYRI